MSAALAFFSLLIAFVFFLCANLPQGKTKYLWARSKVIVYPLFAGSVLAASVFLRKTSGPEYVAYLLFAPAILIILHSIQDQYNPRLPKVYLVAHLVGWPIAAFMVSNYAVASIADWSPLIGRELSLMLGMIPFILSMSSFVGMVGHLLRSKRH